MRFQLKIAFVFGVLVAVLLGGASVFVYRNAAGNVKHELGRRMSAIAAVASINIVGDEHEAIAKKRDMTSPAYKKLKRQLITVLWYVPGFKAAHIYTMRKTGKPDVWEYVVTGDENAEATTLGKTVDVSGYPERLEAYNGPTHDVEPHKSGRGEFLSGYAPILTKEGDAVGVIVVEATTDSLSEKKAYVYRRLAVILVLGLLMTLPCAWAAGRLLADPVDRLIAASEEVRQGNFEARVHIPSHDELGRLGEAFNAMVVGLKEREIVKEAFSKYVSREVAQKILSLPMDQLLAGERRRVSILFTDVRRFTEISEKMRPEEVLDILNDHFSMLIDVLFEFEGTLDKFMGDGLMAIFGAPVTHPNDAERAVRAALRMQEKITDYNRRNRGNGRPELEIGIGVNTGTAVAGNIGSSKRKEYSVIGDTVNLAARLQGIAPAGQVLVSGSTQEELRDILEAEKLPPQNIKGKSGPVLVYRALRFLAE